MTDTEVPDEPRTPYVDRTTPSQPLDDGPKMAVELVQARAREFDLPEDRSAEERARQRSALGGSTRRSDARGHDSF